MTTLKFKNISNQKWYSKEKDFHAIEGKWSWFLYYLRLDLFLNLLSTLNLNNQNLLI